MKYWSRSALSIYKYLSTMSSTIDKIIMDIGKSSNSPTLQKFQSTYYQASKIIELMDRKRKMINLKVSVEEVLNKLDKTNKRILTLVFLDGVKSELVAQMLGMSIRTFFRKKNSAILEFATIFQGLGFDEEFFEKEYANEQWFMSIYNVCISRNTSSEEFMDRNLVKSVINEVSKISFAYNVYV
ncbi:MAG: DUF1492 domain-containing protein [Christensenellales bacterium]